MEIKTLEIKNLGGGRLKGDAKRIRHIKTLPCISVVQSVRGHYEIGLDYEVPSATEEGGAFVAAPGVRQEIIHCNGEEGYMEAQWAFFNVMVNDMFSLEDMYTLPKLLSGREHPQLEALIRTVRSDPSLCKRYGAAYELTDILLQHAVEKPTFFDSAAALIKQYVEAHYPSRITNEDLANVALCSVPNLYRIFQTHFQLSPHNYVNKIRLEKASVLLECSELPVLAVAQRVGFEDLAYFSKLFKSKYGCSPRRYRELVWQKP